MGHSQADKAQSRERILREAAAQIRDAGLESVSVARLMRSAGLTHGGFYGHFASRDELLAEALQRALVEGAAASRAATAAAATSAAPTKAAAPAPTFDAFARSYLSRGHRDARASGCAVAALAADAARAEAPVRAVMSEHVERFIARAAELAGSSDEEAMFAVSAMVGGLLLSRVLVDADRSDAMLKAVRAGLAERAASAPR
ncbi:helix-turn-helix domain-containing protein [Ideonella sp. DXS22W]|uniref:Helix-turn-helix domain-containing protein n=1 Tax=Pseudaquabacterium inlustre TaxID=2984192 RepID=A0ABU9CFP3_9BURK